MLRKIDCVMLKVDDLEAAAAFYADAFGLTRLWSDSTSVGMGMPETDAEMVLHNRPDPPREISVHYLVDDVVSAVDTLRVKGCRVRVEPFHIGIGRCAVLEDPFSNPIAILDMSKGPGAG
jgi:predicted enzyme related to lactoylglutathione lyase